MPCLVLAAGGRGEMSALDAYMAAQRALRREFEPMTRKLCPTCTSPCCRVPARVTPSDAIIALTAGWSAPPGMPDPVVTAAQQASAALGSGTDWEPDTACPFLLEHRCAFPDHLRPHGCVAFLCRPMYAEMDRKQTARVRRLIREMERAHEAIVGTRTDPRDR